MYAYVRPDSGCRPQISCFKRDLARCASIIPTTRSSFGVLNGDSAFQQTRISTNICVGFVRS